MRQHFLETANLNPNHRLTPASAHSALVKLRDQVIKDPFGKNAVTGQGDLVDSLLMCMAVRGHALLEGPPGVNKTRVAELTALRCSLKYSWIQCTPDLLPSDFVWSTVMETDKSGQPVFRERPGKVFANIVVADEINRSGPKTHSGLLEAMNSMIATLPNGPRKRLRPMEPFSEAVWMDDYRNDLKSKGVVEGWFGLEPLDPATSKGQTFVVLSTQNPFEHEGVYPLARAQLDRLLFKFLVDHPDFEHFGEVSRHAFEMEGNEAVEDSVPLDVQKDRHIKTLYFFEALRRNLLGLQAYSRWLADRTVRPKVERLIYLTHLSGKGGALAGHVASNSRFLVKLERQLQKWAVGSDQEQALAAAAAALKESEDYPAIQSGSGVRGYYAIIKGAFARCLLSERAASMNDWEQLLPDEEDIADVALAALRHRIHLAPGARATGKDPDAIIRTLLKVVGLT